MRRLMTSAALLSGAMLTASLAGRPAALHAEAPAVSARASRLVTIPAGTTLRLRVDRAFGSDISRVEDAVAATLVRDVVVNGYTVLPSGSVASGYVADAARPGKVKGRGRVAVRFTRITPAGDDDRYTMRTRSWVAVAPATKKKDALTIGLPAAGGAAVGALLERQEGRRHRRAGRRRRGHGGGVDDARQGRAREPGGDARGPAERAPDGTRRLTAVGAHVVDLHLLRKRGRGVGVAGPGPAHGHVQQQEEVVVEHPADGRRADRRSCG